MRHRSYYTQKIEENPDWELAGIFADKGLSGASMKKRDNFNKMIAACKRGRIDTILTKSLSRFARNTVDCLETVRMLRARGIGVIFEKENINTLTESSEFLITLFSGFAQAEIESLSKNVTWGKEKSRAAGNVPFSTKSCWGIEKVRTRSQRSTQMKQRRCFGFIAAIWMDAACPRSNKSWRQIAFLLPKPSSDGPIR